MQWWRLPSDERWRLLRSIVLREHLHRSGHLQIRGQAKGVANAAPLLRWRRCEIVADYERRGFAVPEPMKAFTIPSGRKWPGLNRVCPANPPDQPSRR
jgi:hypothetical protein